MTLVTGRAGVLLGLLCAACGAPAAVGPPSAGGSGVAAAAEVGSARIEDGAPLEVPELERGPPDADPVEAMVGAVRQAPDIQSLEAATDALRRGFYGELEAAALRECDRGEPPVCARWNELLAKVRLATGRYADVAGMSAAGGSAGAREALELLRAEALFSLGRLREAEAVLTPMARGPLAWRAKGLLAQAVAARGNVPEATRLWMELIDAYNAGTIGSADGEGLLQVARAAWGLGSAQDANDAFRDAVRATDNGQEALLRWAELFLEKYDPGHAEDCVRDVLRINPTSAWALGLLARIRIAQTFAFAAAEQWSERALAVNPNLVLAHVTLAGLDLRDQDFAAAEARLEQAFAVNPVDLEALSVRAAVRFVANDDAGFTQARRAVLGANPRFSRMFTIIADYADWEHRYPEIVELAREALRIDPEDALARATLGMNLLRTGDEAVGLPELRVAWSRDRFNVYVHNTLNLYDDVIASQYEDVASGSFVFRMRRDEKPMLERYVPALLARGYDTMRQRYGFAPDGPIRVELYAREQDFAVRTSGLPNLGVQGVCFGRVITALSPLGGPFNWAQITWHELAHVFHIQLSRHRVPRWFTEGLAEYETSLARPEWARHEDQVVLRALERGRIPPLRLMNRAFTRARSGADMELAYLASARLAEYLVERFGQPRILAMLRAWGEGRDTPAVVSTVLGVSLEVLDGEFRAWLRRRFQDQARLWEVSLDDFADAAGIEAAAGAAPRDAAAQAALAATLLGRGDRQRARAQAERALALDPAEPVAHWVLAQLDVARREPEAAMQHLRSILEGGRESYGVHIQFARLAVALHDVVAARRELEQAARLDPARAVAWDGLATIAGESGDGVLELRALRELARLDPHDREVIGRLLDRLAAGGAWGEIAALADQAVQTDPHRRRTHELLAEAFDQTGASDRARFERESMALSAEAD